MIGLVIGSSDRVISHVDLDHLGIVHQSLSLWWDRSHRRLYVASLNWVVNHIDISGLGTIQVYIKCYKICVIYTHKANLMNHK